MEAFRRTDLLLPLVAGFMAWTLSWWAPAAPLDLLFGTILMTALLVTLRLLISATLQARAGQRRLHRLTATLSDQETQRAVAAERRRLSRDIEQSVLASMRVIAAQAETAASTPDPRDLFRLIQADAARTNVELRRQLGLLQEPDLEPTPVVCAAAGHRHLAAKDLLTAAGLTGLALAEVWYYPRVAPMPISTPVAIGLTLAMTAAVAGRRRYPMATGLTCAALMMIGGVVGQPVLDGISLLGAIGLVCWTLGRVGRWAAWLTIAVFGSTLWATRPTDEFVNALINGLVLVVAATGGALVGHQQRRRMIADIQAEAREGDINRATSAALVAERRKLAHELHDSVSHAVNLIAVQAGAAELCFQRDPALARRSTAIIRATSEQAVAELGRLRPDTAPAISHAAELDALIRRMRGAGLSLEFTSCGDPLPAHCPTVYRVVQESLTNALRHAPGAQVSVAISAHEEETQILIIDEGPGTGTLRPGFGLIGLRERVESLSGSLRCTTGTESGFEVLVRLPSADDSTR